MQMLMPLIPILSIIGVSFFLSRLFSVNSCSMLMVSVCVTIMAMYGFAYGDFLKLGAVFYMAFGFLSLVSMPYYAKKSSIYTQYLSPGLCFSILTIIVSAILVNNYSVYLSDELWHWGPLTKLFYYNDGLINAHSAQISPVYHKNYPPATRCYYYFLCYLVKALR